MVSKKEHTLKQGNMPEEKKPSRYNLLKLDFIFNDEPYWFRCVVILLGLIGFIAIVWVLQK